MEFLRNSRPFRALQIISLLQAGARIFRRFPPSRTSLCIVLHLDRGASSFLSHSPAAQRPRTRPAHGDECPQKNRRTTRRPKKHKKDGSAAYKYSRKNRLRSKNRLTVVQHTQIT